MKLFYTLTIVVVFLSTSCNQADQSDSVDLAEVEKTITTLADNYINAWNASDISSFRALLSDDGQFFGSDPSEQLNKESLLEMYAELFSESTDLTYSIDLRKIIPMADGESALVVEHITMPGWSQLIQMRHISQYIKMNNSWTIDFISWAYIAKNDDIEKLNKVLE